MATRTPGTGHRNQLGEFLRARRGLVAPVDAGLPEAGGRRVSGLRREEVAALAGVSTDYYTRLEQGRERHPSAQVLHAVARTLQLEPAATAYLLRLALPPVEPRTPSPRALAPGLLRMLDALPDVPALVMGPAKDVLAANPLGVALYAGFGRVDNTLVTMFLHQAARSFWRDWDAAARASVSALRDEAGRFPGDARVQSVVAELSQRSPTFAALWARHEVRPKTAAVTALHHPQVGDLDLFVQSLLVAEAPGQRLLTYLPDDAATAERLALLAALSATIDGSGARRPAAPSDAVATP